MFPGVNRHAGDRHRGLWTRIGLPGSRSCVAFLCLWRARARAQRAGAAGSAGGRGDAFSLLSRVSFLACVGVSFLFSVCVFFVGGVSGLLAPAIPVVHA